MGKNKIKIWFIENHEGTSYWSADPDFTHEFQNMEGQDWFKITCKELTVKELEKLEKASNEFEGW